MFDSLLGCTVVDREFLQQKSISGSGLKPLASELIHRCIWPVLFRMTASADWLQMIINLNNFGEYAPESGAGTIGCCSLPTNVSSYALLQQSFNTT